MLSSVTFTCKKYYHWNLNPKHIPDFREAIRIAENENDTNNNINTDTFKIMETKPEVITNKTYNKLTGQILFDGNINHILMHKLKWLNHK